MPKKEPKEKVVNGLRTAVKLGELSPKEAITKLQEMAAETGYLNPKALKWLERRDK